MRYLFPPYATTATTFNVSMEFFKIVEESREAFQAWARELDVEECAIEVLDTIHACETCLRLLDRRYPELDLDVACAKVIEKNSDRGYYG